MATMRTLFYGVGANVLRVDSNDVAQIRLIDSTLNDIYNLDKAIEFNGLLHASAALLGSIQWPQVTHGRATSIGPTFPEKSCQGAVYLTEAQWQLAVDSGKAVNFPPGPGSYYQYQSATYWRGEASRRARNTYHGFHADVIRWTSSHVADVRVHFYSRDYKDELYKDITALDFTNEAICDRHVQNDGLTEILKIGSQSGALFLEIDYALEQAKLAIPKLPPGLGA